MATAEYLKKYIQPASESLTSDTKVRKKKRRKKVKAVSNMQIVDEDADLAPSYATTRSTADDVVEQTLGLGGEDGPVVVTPEELGIREVRRRPAAGQWVTLNDDGDDDDASPPRRRHDSDSESDMDVPRRRLDSDDAASDSETNVPRRRRFDSESPPPRQQDDDDSDQSPPRRRARLDSDSENDDDDDDLSPPRRSGMVDEDGDVSPPRRRRDEMKRPRNDTDDDDSDQSPPRKVARFADDAAKAPTIALPDAAALAQMSDAERHLAIMAAKEAKKKSEQKMSSGASAGLQSAAELKADMERVRKEEEAKWAAIDEDAMGRNATVVRRDKRGRVITKAEQEAKEEAKKNKDDKVNHEWGKGLTQLEEERAAKARLLAEKDAPFARYAEDLDDQQKEIERWGDPMFGKLNKKDKKKKKKSKKGKGGGVLEELSKPEYSGSIPPNRFNIKPGRYWDGIDRSNGYENEYFARKNGKTASATAKYHWSVEEM